MKSVSRRSFLAQAALTSLAAASGSARAQQFPAHDITIIVPYAPGNVDLQPRALADGLKRVLKRNVVVENRTGAGGGVGANFVAKVAPPDGHTILYSNSSVLTIVPEMTSVTYRFEDLVPVVQVTGTPFYLAARADAPYKTLAEFIAFAKKNPGVINYASSGASIQLAGEILQDKAGIKFAIIPFTGSAPIMTALLGSNVDCFIGPAQLIRPQAEVGKLTTLAHTGIGDLKGYPGLTSLRAAGVDMTVFETLGAFVAKDTPKAVIATLADAFRTAMEAPEFKTFCEKNELVLTYRTGEEFAQMIEQDRVQYAPALNRMKKEAKPG